MCLAAIIHAEFARTAGIVFHNGGKPVQPIHAVKHHLAIAVANRVVDYRIARTQCRIGTRERALRLNDKAAPSRR